MYPLPARSFLLCCPHRQVVDTVVAAALGTVRLRFGSLSHTILPSDSFRMNLYSKLVPAGKSTVTNHNGLLEVHCEALSAMPLAGAQVPSWLMLPTKNTFSPKVVVANSSKVTATLVGLAPPVVVVVPVGAVTVGTEVGMPVEPVCEVVGKTLAVGVA